LLGLSHAQKKKLERLGSRRVPPGRILSQDLAREMAAISAEMNRRIGMLVDRAGRIEKLAIGDAGSVEVPRKPSAPAGRTRFCTLRFIATRLGDQDLEPVDLAPIALHLLDALAIIAVNEDGSPGNVRVAHLLPAEEGEAQTAGIGRYRLFPPRLAHQVDDDFPALIAALEEEFDRLRQRTKVSGKEGRAILVHVTTGRRAEAEESMEELAELADSCGLAVVEKTVQRRQSFDRRTLMGSGKLQDLIIHAQRLQADFLIVDQDLSPAQARAIASATELKVVDRSQLILDIFARRARTSEGKIQVELAQLKYLLPRLSTTGDSGLSRLMGGIGGRGPGEQKLEIDRRRVRDRIRKLGKLLLTERRRREQRRSRRRDRNVPVVSLVGYTNAGKSTLLNRLTRSDVFVEHRMFATLDPTSRRLRLPREREIVVNDTVGFIRDLPKDLLSAFQATLEEIEDSDLVIHLVDGCHPRNQARIKAVESILSDLGYREIPRLLVFNKADRINTEQRQELGAGREAVFISATKGTGITPLLDRIDKMLPLRARLDRAY
jgi:GTP-binding protein HflX